MKKTVSANLMTMMKMCMWAFYMCMTCAVSFSDVSSVNG